ncbi:MAG: hypothetical protein RL033_4020 [Pseudomonadota bacterium]
MSRSQQMRVGALAGSHWLQRLTYLSSWLLLAFATALAVAQQLGCGGQQSADGAGGQSGDEGRRGPITQPH